MDVYLKNLFDNHSKRMVNNGPSTTNNNKTTDTTMVEIVIFDDNIISSQPQPQHNRNSNNGNEQMVLNIRQHSSILKDDVNDDYDYDNGDKNSINHDQNKDTNHNAHLCHRHILVHENRKQPVFVLSPCVLLDKNHSSSSSSISMHLSDTHCSHNNNNYAINRNTNTMTSNRKLTGRKEEHRLSRWGASSSSLVLSRWDSSSSSSVPTITETSRLHAIHDIPPKTYSRRMSPATSKATATTDKLDYMNRPNSRFLFKLLEPPQRQSSPVASTIKYVIAKAA